METLSLGKVRLHEDKTKVSPSVPFCPSEIVRTTCAKQWHKNTGLCPLHQTGFHTAGAALSSPCRGWRELCREPAVLRGHTESWDGLQVTNSLALVGSKVGNLLNMALASAVSKTTLPFYTYVESHKFRLVNPDATFCWEIRAKTS